jgi:hypothetical protein
MAAFNNPSCEPEEDIHTWWEWAPTLTGQSAAAQNIKRLELEVSKFCEWTDLHALALEEQDELRAEFEWNRSKSMEMSEYQRNDLAEEFGEDIRALNILSRDYASFEGHSEFINLLNSGSISEREKEALYDVVVNNPEELLAFVDLDLMGEMFPDAESVQDFLSMWQVENNVDKDEIDEVMWLSIDNMQLQDLQYLDTKIQSLFDGWIGTQTQLWQKLLVRHQHIKDRVIALNQISLNSKIQRDQAVSETDTEVSETKAKVSETKTKVSETNTEVNETKETTLTSMRDFIASRLTMFNEQGIILSPKLKQKMKSASNPDSTKLEMRLLQKEVREFFKADPNQIKDLLTQARGKSPTVLRETQQFLDALAEGDPELQKIIKELELELGLGDLLDQWEIREAQATAYFGGEAGEVSDIEIDGQTYTLDDLQIDASDKPPRAYVLWEDGLKLELGLPGIPNDSETLDARRKFAQTQIELKPKLQEVSWEYKEKEGKLQRLRPRLTQLEDAKKAGEILSPKEESELSLLKFEKNQLEKDLAELKTQIEWIYARAAKASKAFELLMSELQFDYAKVQEQQETARFSLKLMKSFGIDRVGQDRFNQMIAEVQNGQLIVDIESPNGFDPAKIDIAAGAFGEVQGEPGGENFRENLVRFTNLMYFWNPEWKNEAWDQIWMNIEIFRRVSEIDNIPGQDPSLVSNMKSPDVNILTSIWDLNVDKARDNLNNWIE